MKNWKKEVKKEKERKKEKKKGRKERDLLRLKLCNLGHWSVNSIEIQQSKRQTCKKAGETILKCQQKEAYRLSGTLRRTAEVCIVVFTPNPHLPFREVAQSCLTLCDPVVCSLPGSSVHGIFQARILEWVAISFSRGSSRPKNRTWVSCIAGSTWATGKPHRKSRTLARRIESQKRTPVFWPEVQKKAGQQRMKAGRVRGSDLQSWRERITGKMENLTMPSGELNSRNRTIYYVHITFPLRRTPCF